MIKQAFKLLGRIQRRSRYEIAKRIMPSTAELGPKVVPRIQGPLTELRDVKLNLGCGPMHLEGYINIDGDPHACADFYMDFSEVGTAFAKQSIAEVLMLHSLSYLNLWQARELLATLHGLLRPGGRLVIELPDIENCAKKLLESSGNLTEYLEGVRGVYAFDPTQIANKSPITPYAFGWSAWHLRQELLAAGFHSTSLHPPEFHGQLWRDIRMEAVK
jgi:SAM-dependent methyltransferase